MNCKILKHIMCFGQKVKTQQQQNKTSNIKTLAGAGNWTSIT